MLLLVTVCRPAKAFVFYSGHPDVCTAIIIIYNNNNNKSTLVRLGGVGVGLKLNDILSEDYSSFADPRLSDFSQKLIYGTRVF